MRQLSSLISSARLLATARHSAPIRNIAVAAIQRKAAIPVEEPTIADLRDAQTSYYKVAGDFDRWLLSRFCPDQFPSKNAVPDTVDTVYMNQARDQFRMWFNTLMMLGSMVICMGMVFYGKSLVDETVHPVVKPEDSYKHEARYQAHRALDAGNAKEA